MKKTLCFFKWSILNLVLFLLTISLNCYAANGKPELSIVTDKTSGAAVIHGLTKLTEAMQAKNITFEKVESINDARGNWIIVTGLAGGNGTASQMLKAGNRSVPQVAEALTIWKTVWEKKPVWVIGGFDDNGTMYGLLDVADRIGWSTNSKSPMSEVKEITEQPDVSDRGVTFYTMNRAYWESRFYDEAYWTRYLDMLARDRFNSMMVIFGYETGGFLAPCYPYFFDVEEYPGIKMVSITPQDQKRNLDALNKLIRMAHDRGIHFLVGIWDHIYRGGVQALGQAKQTDGSKADPVQIVGVTGVNLIPYTKTALTKFIKLVPGLDGIQFRMHDESGVKREEQDSFWLNLFREMKKDDPDINLDLRAKGILPSVIQSAVNVGMNFRITTKYWMEQMGMPWHPTQTNPDRSPIRQSYDGLLVYPQQYKMQWTLWTGGTSRILLWGDPEYVRRFAESSHLYNKEGGYEVNEPLSTKMHGQPHDEPPFDLLNPQYRYYDYEFERYWHFFQLFGRVGYNPMTPSDVWGKEFELRFGKKAGPLVEKALHQASWILPRIVACSYPYSLFPTTKGWPEKMSLGDLPSFARSEGSDLRQFANFDEEAQLLIERGETARMLPSMSSKWFEQTSADINRLIDEAEKAIGKNRNKEFNSTIVDLKILSNLALYHSRRIPAAVSYHLFERTKDVSALDEAITFERNAIDAWRQIVASAGDVYAPNLKFGPENVNLTGHWKGELANLEKGLASLEQKRHDFKAEGTVKPAPRYKVAESANNDKLFKISHLPAVGVPEGKPITVSIKVSAPAGVKWVHLLYRSVNQDVKYQTLPMQPSGEKDTYQVTVPAEQINLKWDFMYLIEVMDNNGKGKIVPDFNKETPYIIVKLIR